MNLLKATKLVVAAPSYLTYMLFCGKFNTEIIHSNKRLDYDASSRQIAVATRQLEHVTSGAEPCTYLLYSKFQMFVLMVDRHLYGSQHV